MNVLALDLATTTGWAYNDSTGLHVGTWELAMKREITHWGKLRLPRRQDPRITRLRDKVKRFCGTVDCIIFEDVEFGSSRMQTQLWSSLRAAVWLACDYDIHYDCVNVKTLKKWGTGNGNATKEQMIFAAQTQRPDLKFDADSADAFHLWTFAQKHIKI